MESAFALHAWPAANRQPVHTDHPHLTMGRDARRHDDIENR